MNVAMVVNNLAVSGGYQKLVLRLARELEYLGHATTIYTLQVDREACYPDDIGDAEIIALATAPGSPSETWGALAALIPRDVEGLVFHDEAGLEVLCHLTAAPRRVVWMLNNELDVLARRMRLSNSLLRHGGSHAAYRHWRRLRAAARRVDAFAVYDNKNAEAVRTHLGREPSLVYAGADVERFEPIRERRAPRSVGDPLRVVSVGVLFPHRRYEDIIDALELLSTNVRVDVTIVGLHTFHPPYASMLRDRVAKRSLGERVSFVEYLAESELDRLYAMADAFVFANDGLTWGIAVFEALAAGLPLVISRTAGAADLLVDGRHAWIVPPQSPAAIAAALDEIAASPDEAVRRTAVASSEVLDVVRWPSFAARIEALLVEEER